MSEYTLWLAAANGIIGGLLYIWGRHHGRKQHQWLSRAEKRDVWNQGHEDGFWNGRLSHGDPQALTGIEHAKATNPYINR